MTVLVAAASKHGATAEIAARIGANLTTHGLDVEIKKIEEIAELSRYEAVVLGSGIYYLGTWLKPARRFLDAHAAELAHRPGCSPAARLSATRPSPTTPMHCGPGSPRGWSRRRTPASTNSSRASSTRASSDCSRKPPCAAPATKGDHRDWQAIDDWAPAIARELQSSRVASRP
jgi:menaquinone-dependent protoporphyrinogen oxidase